MAPTPILTAYFITHSQQTLSNRQPLFKNCRGNLYTGKDKTKQINPRSLPNLSFAHLGACRIRLSELFSKHEELKKYY
jgi:hypothetical protein